MLQVDNAIFSGKCAPTAVNNGTRSNDLLYNVSFREAIGFCDTNGVGQVAVYRDLWRVIVSYALAATSVKEVVKI